MMTLAQLLQPLLPSNIQNALNSTLEISGLVTDNRDVKTGDCFIALAGITHHGKHFIDDAIARGASAILVEESENSIDVRKNTQGIDIPVIAVTDLKAQLNTLLINFYQASSSTFAMRLLGVTGTNGKSSITRFVAQMSTALHQPAGLMGTLGFGVWPTIVESKNTTPELAVLLRQFGAMQASGAEIVAMEVSSHGIEQQRIEGLTFDSAVFANLSQDHLDYHGDMNSYALAKRRLFSFNSLSHSIFCLDDSYASFMAEGAVESSGHYYSEQDTRADFYVKQLTLESAGCRFVLCHPEGETPVFLPLLGRFNVQNALAALASLWYGVNDKATLISGLSTLSGAPGRMDKVQLPNAPLVVVDFAHTSDALEVALQGLKEHTNGRLICVFGCGGDRDRGKRPLMMAAAMQNADYVWLTSDNPRTESVEQIFSDVLAQTNDDDAFSFEPDRRVAIRQAVLSAGPNDVVLIAGKGHETYQDIQGVKHHFDDKEEALKAIEAYVD